MKCTQDPRSALARAPIATLILLGWGAVASSSAGCGGTDAPTATGVGGSVAAGAGGSRTGGAGGSETAGSGGSGVAGAGGSGSVSAGGAETTGRGGSGGANAGGAETVRSGGSTGTAGKGGSGGVNAGGAGTVSSGGSTGTAGKGGSGGPGAGGTGTVGKGGSSGGGAVGTGGASGGAGGTTVSAGSAFPNVNLAGTDEASVRNALAASLGTDEVIFVKRNTYDANHYYTEYINSSWMPGGGIYVLNLKTGAVRSVVSNLSNGVFRRFDVSFDGTKIVFDFKKNNDSGYRIYEAEIAKGEARAVTVPPSDEASLISTYRNCYHHGTDDMDPAYLPDGGIVFTSTRSQLGTLCDSPDCFTSPNLHRIELDGTKLTQLSVNATSEFTPTMLPDGRILYSRWEYVDKASAAIKCQWAMYPNGAASSEVYKNDINLPPSTTQGRIIPGSLNHYLFLGTPHYEWNQLGTIYKIDMTKNIRTRDPITLFTPELDATDHTVVTWKANDGSLYRDPYPLNETQALASYKPGSDSNKFSKAGYGLYLVETASPAAKTYQFYRDSAISCWQPMPLKARNKPPIATINLDPDLAAKKLAIVSVQDVYFGMENVARGSVKWLRVMEQLPRPWTARHFWGGDEQGLQHAAISRNTHFAAQVRWGVVPVEEDGSAQFYVPANRSIFFAALDKDFRLIQQERTFVNYKPGERRACIGCHETPNQVPPPTTFPTAFQREPSEAGPQRGETTGQKVLDYEWTVQPVWDKNCVSCHGPTKKDGNLDLGSSRTTLYNTSYEQLMDRRSWLLGLNIDEEPRNPPETSKYLPAYSLYGNNAVLLKMLGVPITLTGQFANQASKASSLATSHASVKLTDSELQTVSEFLDTNLQYYGHYWGRRNTKYSSHANFRPKVTFEQAIGTVNPSSNP
jgi:hypothetical protein